MARSRQRRVHEGEADDPLGILRGEGVSHHVADVVRHEVRAFDPERVEQAGNILTLCLLVVSSGRAGGEPHPAQIGGNNGVVAGKLRCKRRPHITCLTIPVKQDNRRSLSANPYREGRAIRSDVLNFETGWKRLHICGGGHRECSLEARNRPWQFCCSLYC